MSHPLVLDLFIFISGILLGRLSILYFQNFNSVFDTEHIKLWCIWSSWPLPPQQQEISPLLRDVHSTAHDSQHSITYCCERGDKGNISPDLKNMRFWAPCNHRFMSVWNKLWIFYCFRVCTCTLCSTEMRKLSSSKTQSLDYVLFRLVKYWIFTMLVLFNKYVIKLHNVITLKTTICIFTTVKTSKYIFCRCCRQVNPICNTKFYTEYEIGRPMVCVTVM
jgi:hypothetical protein